MNTNCPQCKFIFCRCDSHESRIKNRADPNFNDWYNSLKDLPCADCNVKYPYWVTHWHHLNPNTKLAEVSKLKSTRDRGLVLKEIEKCILLCANCHADRTFRGST